MSQFKLPRRQERQREAAARQAAYNALSLDEKILRAVQRGSSAYGRELTRLARLKRQGAR